ncbi:MAG TPA: serine/threonine-protein kinase [Gaiellaceae bacterium]|nr:serine/threonine-protein kinase [Gaiellaceae bacterium]
MAEQVIAARYRLEQRVGVGAMAEVWSATDLELDRQVAVKLLAPEADPARFEREARAAAALSHPNICALYAYGESDGRPYMVLEYLPGGSLEDRLAGGRPLADAEAERIAADVAAGLAQAHARGVVHRDLKPANVLFDADGRAKIADFGIARAAGAPGMTEVGTVLGTPAYISPEQAAGSEATPASDVYAFGVILYRMLTGRLPFESADPLALAAMHREQEPRPVSAVRPDAPPRLESLATAALAKSPFDRPPDGGALAAELRRPAPEDTAATQILTAATPSRRRTPLVLLAAGALAAAGVALAIGVTFSGGGGTPAKPPSVSRTEVPRDTTRPRVPVTIPTAAEETTEPRTTEAATTATTREASTTEPTTTTAPEPTATEPTTVPTTTAAPPATTTPTTAPLTTTPLTTAPVTTAPPPPPPPTFTETATTEETTTVDTTATTSAPTTTMAATTTAAAATTPATTTPG